MSVTSSSSRTTFGSRAACVYVQRAFSARRICLQLEMTERTDQRISITFCFSLDKSCTETIEMIQKVFVDKSMGITQIKEWYRRFKNGTSKSEPCQVNADYFYRLWGCCAQQICSKRSDDRQRILRWCSEKIAWYRKKRTAFLVKRWLASSPR